MNEDNYKADYYGYYINHHAAAFNTKISTDEVEMLISALVEEDPEEALAKIDKIAAEMVVPPPPILDRLLDKRRAADNSMRLQKASDALGGEPESLPIPDPRPKDLQRDAFVLSLSPKRMLAQ